MIKWKVIARHKWVMGAVITESYDINNDLYRRFTATIRGWRNWRIMSIDVGHESMESIVKQVKSRVIAIRDRIDAGDETVFYKN